MTTRATFTKIAGLVILGGIAAGCGTTATAKPAAPPASTSAPAAAAQTFTDPNGLACPANQETAAGYCPGDDPTIPPATPSDSPFGMDIGTPAHMTDDTSGAAWDVTLNSVKHFTQGQYDSAAPTGSHYIIVNVVYDATTGPVDVNEWDWSAKDTTGLVNSVQLVTGGPNDLSSTTIQTGNKIRGTVVLAITDGSGGTVVYSAGGSEQASWNFTAAQATS
jgi:hypothetical protein